MPRSRLSPNQRREQLLDAGEEVLLAHSYDELSLEEVARRSGVSRALVYHYFPGKKELFSAIWKRAHDELLAQASFDRPIPLADQVRQSLLAHLRFYEHNAPLVLI